MAKNSIRDYDSTSSNNSDVQSVDISEGCSPSGINNAIREVMADLADVNEGTIALESPKFDSIKDGNIKPPDASGTDVAGTDTTIKGGAGTGTGAGGSIVFQTADGGSTGSSVNAHATAMTITDDGSVGVGTTSTVAQSKMTIAGNSLSITGYDNGFTSGGNRAMIDFGANYMRLGGLTGGGSTVNGIKFITPAGGDAAILDSDGLKFNGDTAAANALDDYEEGTWAPIDDSGASLSFTITSAQYVKIGKLVMIQTYLTFPTTSNASAVAIGGLPFTVGTGYYYMAGRVQGQSDKDVVAQINQSDDTFALYYNNGQLQNSTLSGSYVLVSGCYKSAS